MTPISFPYDTHVQTMRCQYDNHAMRMIGHPCTVRMIGHPCTVHMTPMCCPYDTHAHDIWIGKTWWSSFAIPITHMFLFSSNHDTSCQFAVQFFQVRCSTAWYTWQKEEDEKGKWRNNPSNVCFSSSWCLEIELTKHLQFWWHSLEIRTAYYVRAFILMAILYIFVVFDVFRD